MPTAKLREPTGTLSGNRPNRREEAVLDEGGIRSASATWDFAVDGGTADSAISLGRTLPSGAVIVRLWTDEQTAVTGATDCDFRVGGTAINTSAIDFTGDAGIQSRAATPLKLSADSECSVIFNTAAATAGKVRFFLEYLLPTD